MGSDKKSGAAQKPRAARKSAMPEGRPKLIDIEHDDYHATHVGRAADGRQFFVTGPFEPQRGDRPRREFRARYLWAADGAFLEAKIEERTKVEDSQAAAERLLAELGKVRFCRVRVAPFSVERFGLKFGLITRSTEGAGKHKWAVEVLPGNYMCFFAPWDSGEYDT
jgi:hypothetical protein